MFHWGLNDLVDKKIDEDFIGLCYLYIDYENM